MFCAGQDYHREAKRGVKSHIGTDKTESLFCNKANPRGSCHLHGALPDPRSEVQALSEASHHGRQDLVLLVLRAHNPAACSLLSTPSLGSAPSRTACATWSRGSRSSSPPSSSSAPLFPPRQRLVRPPAIQPRTHKDLYFRTQNPLTCSDQYLTGSRQRHERGNLE